MPGAHVAGDGENPPIPTMQEDAALQIDQLLSDPVRVQTRVRRSRRDPIVLRIGPRLDLVPHTGFATRVRRPAEICATSAESRDASARTPEVQGVSSGVTGQPQPMTALGE